MKVSLFTTIIAVTALLAAPTHSVPIDKIDQSNNLLMMGGKFLTGAVSGALSYLESDAPLDNPASLARCQTLGESFVT